MELLISLPQRMVESLILTIIVEAVFAWIIGFQDGRSLIVIMVTNVLTNPALLFTHTVLVTSGYPHWPVVIVLEILVVLIEWIIFRKFAKGIKRPLVFAFIVNFSSFFIGLMFDYLF